jgi:serine acetyltransferase
MATLFLCGAGNAEGVRLAQAVNRRCHRWDRIVLLDDDPAKHGQRVLGVDIIGGFDQIARADEQSDQVVNLVARTAVKRWAARVRIAARGLRFAPLVSADVDTTGATHAEDATIYQNATLGATASLGEGAVLFMGAIAGHGAEIGRGCILAPNAVVNARVKVGDGVYIGSNAAVLPDLTIGAWATIGAGSVITRDVPAGVTVMARESRVSLSLAMKLKMGAFNCLPEHLRWVLERLAHDHARTHSGADLPGHRRHEPVA